MSNTATLERASPLVRVVRVWFAVLGGIAAWTVHLIFVASFVSYSCNVHGVTWAYHVATGVTTLITLAAMWLSWLLVKSSNEPESSPTEGGRARFLGLFGLAIGGINVILILLEGFYVPFLHHCG